MIQNRLLEKYISTIIIYGAGGMGKTLFPQIEANFADCEIIFADSNPAFMVGDVFGRTIIAPTETTQNPYGKICFGKDVEIREILEQ